MALFQAHGRATLIDAGRITAISGTKTLSNVKVARGGILQPQDGVTITIESFNEVPGAFQWIDLSLGGTVVIARSACKRVNAKWFGAVGDGVTDDTDAIQAWINSVITASATQWLPLTYVRQRLYLPAGCYRVSASLIIPECIGLAMEGDGTAEFQLTTIQWNGDADSSDWLLDARSVLGFGLRNIAFIGQKDIDDAGSACIANGILTRRLDTGLFNSANDWDSVTCIRFTGIGYQFGDFPEYDAGYADPVVVGGQTDNSLFKHLTARDCRVGFVINHPSFLHCKFIRPFAGSYGGNPVDGGGTPIEDGNAAPVKFRTKNAVQVLYGQFVATESTLYAVYKDADAWSQYAIYCQDGSVTVDGYSEARYFAYFANGGGDDGGFGFSRVNSLNDVLLIPGAEGGGPVTAGKYPVYYDQTKVPLKMSGCKGLYVVESARSAGVLAHACQTEQPAVATLDTATWERNPRSSEDGCSYGAFDGTEFHFTSQHNIGAGLGIVSDADDEFLLSTHLAPRRQADDSILYQFTSRGAGNTTARALHVSPAGVDFYVITGLSNGSTYSKATLLAAANRKFTAIRPQTSVTNGTTVLNDGDDSILGDATSGTVFLTLPTAVGRAGKRFTATKTDAGGNGVVFEAQASQTVDGAASLSMNTQYESRTVESDGVSNWYVVAGNL